METMPSQPCAPSKPVECARETAYLSGVRWWLFAACVVGLAGAGCYNPKVASGSFACSPTDNPPCPAGFYCVDNLCLDHPGPPGSGGGGDMASGTGGNGGGDFATAPADMAGADLAQSSASDMAQSSSADMTMCTKSGDFCIQDSECCSGTCLFPLGCL